MRNLFPPSLPVSVPIQGTALLYPVRRIWCVGQNYDAHQKEMNPGLKERVPPFFFAKPCDSIVLENATGSTGKECKVPYPSMTKDFHYEVELVVAMGLGTYSNLSLHAARSSVYGYAVGIDLTRRDLQAIAKKTGRPWDMGKGFDLSAPMTSITPATSWTVGQQKIELKVNGQVKQTSSLDQMIWDVPNMIAELSKYVVLEQGDLIFTGTPSGVGPVVTGDVMDATIDGLGALRVVVGPPLSDSKL